MIYQINRFQASPERVLPDVVKRNVNRNLKGARVLDVSWSSSDANVNYQYDKLYDARVTYQRNGNIKRFTAVYGLSEEPRVWMTPNTSDLEILDDEAKLIHNRKKNPEQKGTANSGSADAPPE